MAVFFQLLGFDDSEGPVLINRLLAGPRTATPGARRRVLAAGRNMVEDREGKGREEGKGKERAGGGSINSEETSTGNARERSKSRRRESRRDKREMRRVDLIENWRIPVGRQVDA
jgi:hypothetical protein